MSVFLFLFGVAVGYGVGYFQHNPAKLEELMALFKPKDKP